MAAIIKDLKEEAFKLNNDGSILAHSPTSNYSRRNLNFNHFTVFAEYSLEFAPGSFVYIVWKNENLTGNSITDHKYFKNLDRILETPHNNNLSVRVLYYLDYLDFKKWKKRK